MVEGFCGLPGAGKTYWISKLGLEAIKKGRKVYANFSLKGAEYYSDLRDLFEIRNGLILVDEINLLCPSRWWDRLPPHLAYFWSQTRKQQLDIYWTAQHPDRVDKIVREISNWIWLIRKLPFNCRFLEQYLPEQVNKVKKVNFGFKVFYINKGVYSRYNTYERVEEPGYVKYPTKEFRKNWS